MGLLTPLYALAALAIAGPILLHLIRRQPQGEQQFSSLMFLKPSPPTMTRRSRLENWLLLFLRIAAIALIAFAFARPYLREESLLNLTLEGRHIVLLVDTSASMRRPGVWESAVEELEEVVDSVGPEDRVALYTVDQEVKSLIGLESKATLDAQLQKQAVEAALQSLQPTWFRSEVGEGLSTIADQLAAIDSEEAAVGVEIVLVTDLHEGCGVESLQGYPWPKNVQLDIRKIAAEDPGNAFVTLMENVEDGQNADGKQSLRVRLENGEESETQNLELQWVGGNDVPLASTRVQVPSGQVRVIPLPPQPSESSCLRLVGDAWQDDNDLYLFKPKPKRELVAYIGAEELTRGKDPKQHPKYFLDLAPLNTELVLREVVEHQAEDIPALTTDPDCKVLVLEPSRGTLEFLDEIGAFAEAGGVVLACLSDDRYDKSLTAEFLQGILGDRTEAPSEPPGVGFSGANGTDYALVGWVDYRHPVFEPFADPRFNDFSKIRIWQHFQINLPESYSDVRTVSKFDDGSPMLLHRTVKKGDVWVLATGWQPEASSLALSTKFVPILNGLLDPRGFARQAQLRYEVGQKIDFAEGAKTLYDETGMEISDEQAQRNESWVRFNEPGLYFIGAEAQEVASDVSETSEAANRVLAQEQIDDAERWLAVQVPASERVVTPLDVDVMEQYGVALGKVNSESQRKDAARQLQVEELENRQKLWQWLLGLGVLILVVETLLAGRAARQEAAQPATI